MTVNFADFDVAELEVLQASDALGLPEMGASIIVEYVDDVDNVLGDTGLNVDGGSSCCCCCCC